MLLNAERKQWACKEVIFLNQVELYHHGVKGQKWGVRRYQKEDGTRTALGKKRRNEVDISSAHDDYKKAHTTKHYSQMSDKELREVNNRLNMERQYAQLNKKEVTAGQKFLSTVVVGSATIIASRYAQKYMDQGVQFVIGKLAKK